MANKKIFNLLSINKHYYNKLKILVFLICIYIYLGMLSIVTIIRAKNKN